MGHLYHGELLVITKGYFSQPHSDHGTILDPFLSTNFSEKSHPKMDMEKPMEKQSG
jgi:hypothetical protein